MLRDMHALGSDFDALGWELVLPDVRQQLDEQQLLDVIGDIDATICGDDRFTARVMDAAPKLKAGRALQIINGPAMGRVFNSMTEAMQAATAAQRRELGLGTSKKGLPKSGWDFWRPVAAKRMSA